MYDLQVCLDAMGIGIDLKSFLDKQNKILREIDKSTKAQQEISRHNALGHALRYRMYTLLQEGEYCLTILAHILKKSKSTISHHLSILEQAGLVIGRKKGLFTVYSAMDYFLLKNVRQTE